MQVEVGGWVVYAVFFGLCALMSLFCASNSKEGEFAKKEQGMNGVILSIVLFMLTTAVFYFDNLLSQFFK